MSELAERAIIWALMALVGLGLALPVAIIVVRFVVYVIGALWGAALDPMADWFPVYTSEASNV